MREDMGKVVVNRPRRGSRSKNIKTGIKFRGPNVDYDNLDEIIPTNKIGHKRLVAHSGESRKDFNEHLEPLRRYLISSCGRPWNKVFSEISEQCPVNSILGHHIIKDHLFWYIDINAYEENGVIYSDREGTPISVKDVDSSRNIAYVHPKTGILTRYKGKTKRIGWFMPGPHERELDYLRTDTREWRKVNGNWLSYEYTYDPGEEDTTFRKSYWGKLEDGTNGILFKNVTVKRKDIPGFEHFTLKGTKSLNKKQIKSIDPKECGNYDFFVRIKKFIPSKNWAK